MAVLKYPGAMALKRMLRFAHSAANARNAELPRLEELYGAAVGTPTSDVNEPMCMVTPKLRALLICRGSLSAEKCTFEIGI